MSLPIATTAARVTTLPKLWTIAALIFDPTRNDDADKLGVAHVQVDEEQHVTDYTVFSADFFQRESRFSNLRAIFLAEGENAVRERLGLTPLPLRVWTNQTDWYVAASLDDVRATWAKHLGEAPSDFDPEDWQALPDESPLGIHPDEAKKEPAVVKTCAQWIAENGRGFLCSTEC